MYQLMSQPADCCPRRLGGEILTINVLLFLEVRDFMFFRREKQIISHFAGFLRGPRLRFAQDNLDVKKISWKLCESCRENEKSHGI
jgi:hypothetical protein